MEVGEGLGKHIWQPVGVVDPGGVGGGGKDCSRFSTCISAQRRTPASLLMLLTLLAGCFPSIDDKQAVCAQRCSFSSRSRISIDPKLGHRGAVLKCLMMSELLYCLLEGSLGIV